MIPRGGDHRLATSQEGNLAVDNPRCHQRSRLVRCRPEKVVVYSCKSSERRIGREGPFAAFAGGDSHCGSGTGENIADTIGEYGGKSLLRLLSDYPTRHAFDDALFRARCITGNYREPASHRFEYRHSQSLFLRGLNVDRCALVELGQFVESNVLPDEDALRQPRIAYEPLDLVRKRSATCEDEFRCRLIGSDEFSIRTNKPVEALTWFGEPAY
jgi:hypothetical protein